VPSNANLLQDFVLAITLYEFQGVAEDTRLSLRTLRQCRFLSSKQTNAALVANKDGSR
jgi:hypothetical protein